MLTNAGLADVAVHLRLVLARTARRLRQESGADLSPSLVSALSSIDRHGPLTPSELAAHERVQRPTATRVLARLEEAGLIERAPSPDDGRVAHLRLTEEGDRRLGRTFGELEMERRQLRSAIAQLEA
jgi:DNA-binding MarR family transcriptional regulator